MKLREFIESKRFESFIIVLIMINAITLGLETEQEIMDAAGPALIMIDRIILAIFTIEVLVKLWGAFSRMVWFNRSIRLFVVSNHDFGKLVHGN